MNLLNGISVYLAGPVEILKDEESSTWRDRLGVNLKEKFNCTILDPLKKPKWFKDITPEEQRQSKKDLISGFIDKKKKAKKLNDDIRKICLSLAGQAGFIICNLTKVFTAGTFEEIYLARQCNKPVLFITPENQNDIISTWLYSAFVDVDEDDEVFFNTEEDVIEYLEKVDKGESEYIKTPPYRWSFLTWGQ